MKRLLCKFGLHTPYYFYENGPPGRVWAWQHVGWRCKFCLRPYKREVRCLGAHPSLWQRISTWVQPL